MRRTDKYIYYYYYYYYLYSPSFDSPID